MGKDIWIMEHERAMDDFAESECQDVESFTASLRELGFNPDEIQDEIAAAKGEMV